MILRPPPDTPQPRKGLSADDLYALARSVFEQIPDHRHEKAAIPLADALLSAVALFALKDPSLLAFQERRNDQNLKQLFGIGRIPSDTQMREILDPLEPAHLRPAFRAVFRQLQRGKALEPFVFYQGCYLLALDGTEYFSSPKVHCEACQQRVDKKTGVVTYYHQMLGAAIVHPDHREVIPLCPEPIIKQDGSTKNDCERNAARRWLRQFRQEHPRLKVIIIEDGLSSNAPHIRELLDLKLHFILGVKPGDHALLFEQVIAAFDADRATTFAWTNEKGIRCEIAFVNQLPLNESNPDLLVNFLQYSEYDDDGHRQKYFTWVTDFTIQRQNAQLLVRGGRARWKIENETFNTLKNQGYQFEHNFGHGEQHLSVVFALLMMLAFLIDQAQQLCCPLFRAVWQKLGSKRSLWDHLRSHFRHFTFTSMQHLYEVMLYDLAKNQPAPTLDTS
jgi:hypothetical protein